MFKDGMIHLNGKDYLFAKCNGYVQTARLFCCSMLTTLFLREQRIRMVILRPRPFYRHFFPLHLLPYFICHNITRPLHLPFLSLALLFSKNENPKSHVLKTNAFLYFQCLNTFIFPFPRFLLFSGFYARQGLWQLQQNINSKLIFIMLMSCLTLYITEKIRMGPECVAERCIAFVFSGSMFLKLIRTHFTMNF